MTHALLQRKVVTMNMCPHSRHDCNSAVSLVCIHDASLLHMAAEKPLLVNASHIICFISLTWPACDTNCSLEEREREMGLLANKSMQCANISMHTVPDVLERPESVVVVHLHQLSS